MSYETFAAAIAWISSVFCTWLSARCAYAFLAHKPRHFQFMALFALTWAFLIAFYSSTTGDPLLAAFGGFLLVLGCGILRSEIEPIVSSSSIVTITGKAEVCVHPSERLALKLLTRLVPTTTLAIALPEYLGFKMVLPRSDSFLIFAVLMDAVGYYAVAITMSKLGSRLTARYFFWLVSVYLVAEVVLVLWVILGPGSYSQSGMAPTFRLIFSAAKIVFCGSVCYAVVCHGMKPELRQLPTYELAMRMFGMAADVVKPDPVSTSKLDT